MELARVVRFLMLGRRSQGCLSSDKDDAADGDGGGDDGDGDDDYDDVESSLSTMSDFVHKYTERACTSALIFSFFCIWPGPATAIGQLAHARAIATSCSQLLLL